MTKGDRLLKGDVAETGVRRFRDHAREPALTSPALELISRLLTAWPRLAARAGSSEGSADQDLLR